MMEGPGGGGYGDGPFMHTHTHSHRKLHTLRDVPSHKRKLSHIAEPV